MYLLIHNISGFLKIDVCEVNYDNENNKFIQVSGVETSYISRRNVDDIIKMYLRHGVRM
jgi:hypothetical protein